MSNSYKDRLFSSTNIRREDNDGKTGDGGGGVGISTNHSPIFFQRQA